MTLLNNCSACLRALQPRRLPTRALGSRFRSSGLDPEPRTIDEDEDDFDDVLSELHRRRKKQDAKRNRQVSSWCIIVVNRREAILLTFSE